MKAMKALASRAREVRSHPTVVGSPEYEPQANGLAGRCIQFTKGMFRSIGDESANRCRATTPL